MDEEYEFEVQGYYAHGWEAVDTQPTREEGRASLAIYRANEDTLFRMRRVRAQQEAS